MDKNGIKTKIKDNWGKYESKIVLVLGFILVTVISFEAGLLIKADLSQKTLVIEKPALASAAAPQNTSQGASQAQNSTSDAKNSLTSPSIASQNCIFVGSKNSRQYHLPTSSYVKLIKPENLVCFSSADEAQSRGYSPDKSLSK